MVSNHASDGCSFGQPSFPKNKKSRELNIVSVATDLPMVVQSPLWKEVAQEQKLAAWTSIRQERWEGELCVNGEIPQWLVCVVFVSRCVKFLIMIH